MARVWRRLLGSLPFRSADHELAEELESRASLHDVSPPLRFE